MSGFECTWGGYLQTEKGLVYLDDPTLKLSDADYLTLISAKIQANKASGTVPDIHDYLVTGRGLDSDLSIYDNIGSADVTIIDDDLMNQQERYLLNKIGPRSAGVTTDITNWTFEYLPFTQNLTNIGRWKIPELAPVMGTDYTKVLKCNDALGDVCWVPIVQYKSMLTADAAYGTWSFWFKKDTANTSWTMPIASAALPVSDATQDGYAISFNSSEQVELYEVSSGVTTQLFGSASAAFDDNWHKWTMTRSALGAMSIYLDDTLVTATFGTNPVTDTTHTTSVYWTFQMDLGDYLGLVTSEDVKLTTYAPL